MDRVITPEFIQAVVGVLVILLSSLFPQWAEQISIIAGAVVVILVGLFAAQAYVKSTEIKANAAIVQAASKKDC